MLFIVPFEMEFNCPCENINIYHEIVEYTVCFISKSVMSQILMNQESRENKDRLRQTMSCKPHNKL